MKLLYILLLSTMLFANKSHNGDHMHNGKIANHEKDSMKAAKSNLGSVLYAACKLCHGLKAEKKYMNKIPAINNLDSAALESILRLYKKGELNTYGFGEIMKTQMRNIPKEKIQILAKYIQTL